MCRKHGRQPTGTTLVRLQPSRAAAAAALIVGLSCIAASAGETSAKLKINRSVAVAATGDGRIKLEVKMSAEAYTRAKANSPNTAVLLRRLGAGNDWTKLENIKGRFDDDSSSFVIEYTQLGLARLTGDDLWEISFASADKHELLATLDTSAVLSTAQQTDLGEAAVSVRIEIPKTGKDISLLHNPERVTYRYAPTLPAGTTPQATFALETREHLMSVLARPYANSQLSNLWAARSVFKNTGEQVISDYRVHYRIGGFSEFSEWKKTRRVLPGQTVVDPYFPLLDLERLGQLASSRPVVLEVEYEYRQQDGRSVRESDTRQVQLLGRNQVAFSSVTADEAVGFLDKFNNAPAILASLVNGDDSVMQDLAGRLNQLAEVSVATQKDEDARTFISNLYAFFGNNRIGLQTPLEQSVKFGRDVIRTRSGTYLDLAVLFASACEAAGLPPLLHLTADNCLVTVKLPGGQTVTLDVSKAAAVTAAKAQEEGARLLQEAQAKGTVYDVDIARWRSQGVRSIDLPPLENNLLAAQYRFAKGDQKITVQTTPATGQTTTTAGATKVEKGKLAGRWSFEEVLDGRTAAYTLTVTVDGSYSYRAVVTSGGKVTADVKEEGTYELTDTQLKFLPAGGKQANVYAFRLRGDDLDMQLQGSPKLVTFQRGK